MITEIPAGKLDSKSEDRLSAAKRELEEETGLCAKEWIELGDYVPAAAYCDEVIALYLAKGLHKGQRHLDEDEFLNIRYVDLDELSMGFLGAVTFAYASCTVFGGVF